MRKVAWIYICATLIAAYRAQIVPSRGVVSPAPVLLIPGLAGTALEGRYNNTESLPSCAVTNVTTDWTCLWLSLSYFSPPRRHQQCWFDIMTLKYVQSPFQSQTAGLTSQLTSKLRLNDRNSLGVWTPPEGVEIRPVEGLAGVDFLTHFGSYSLSPSRYFHDIISTLKEKAQLVPQQSLDAFAYDWRLPPWQHDWEKLRVMIEQLRKQSQKPVVIIVHSMGMILFNYFLANHVDVAWKQLNVRAIISINGAGGGSFKAIRAFISGYNPAQISWLHYLDLPQLVPDANVKEMARTFASVFMLTPLEDIYHEDTPVASDEISGVEYTIRNWTDLLPAQIRSQWTTVRKYVGQTMLQDPGVPLYCLYSRAFTPNTDVHFSFRNELSVDNGISLVEGDGTLPLSSLRICSKYESTVVRKEFANLDHMEVLRHSSVTDYISQLVSAVLN